MKTLASGPYLLALAVSALTGIGRAAVLPPAPVFSTAPLEVPSLGLKENRLLQIIPDGPRTFEGFSKHRSKVSRSPIDQMPIAVPRADLDYSLIVKAPDPKVDYKMLLREIDPPPISK